MAACRFRDFFADPRTVIRTATIVVALVVSVPDVLATVGPEPGRGGGDRALPRGGCAAVVEFDRLSAAPGATTGDKKSGALADLDGDGDLDVVLANSAADRVTWHQNTNGLGAFGPERHVAIDQSNPRSVAIVDADGDGDNDVVAAGQAWIRWFVNTDGLGKFEIHRSIREQDANYQAVLAADLDADGDADVISASWQNPDVAWYENSDGAGQIATRHTITTIPSFATSVAVGDLDGDGDPDVASGSSGLVSWYENTNAQGSFGPLLVVASESGSSVAISDLDGDGDNDVVFSSFDADLVAWSRNLNGAGSFGGPLAINAAAFASRSVATGDFDGDGDQDVQAGRAGPGSKLIWHENLNGAGTFGPETGIDDFTPESIATADIDGDGDTDLLSTHSGAYWFANDRDDCNQNGINDACEPAGVAEACIDRDGDGVSFAADCDDGNPRCSSDCTDTDGDGFCVASDCDDSTPYCSTDCTACAEDCDFDGVPDPFAVAPHFTTTRFAPDFTDGESVLAVDLDGDGDLDALAAVDARSLVRYENVDGRGAFGPQQFITETPGDIRWVDAADVDGDSDVDALVVFGSSGGVAWYANDGSGGFGAIHSVDVASARSATVADLDGDGDGDIVVSGEVFMWYENTSGDGLAWQEHLVDIPACCGQSVFAVDLDGDDDLDVLSFLGGDLQTVWYRNLDGQGSFGPPQQITGDACETAIIAADMDGDGDADVVCASHSNQRTTWYANQGSFVERSVSQSVAGPTSVFAADLDDDGDNDLLTGSFYDGLIWHENLNGSGGFGPQHAIPDAEDYVEAVVAADLDGDGDTDALSATRGISLTEGIAWHENLRDNCNHNALPDACEEPEVAAVCTDVDHDGFNVLSDCDDANAGAWLEPGTVLLVWDFDETPVLTWSEPDPPGAASVRFDVLRSGAAFDFTGPAICLDSGISDRVTEDPDTPAVGVPFHYLIRADNDCSGPGSIGADSDGVPRTGLDCP